MIYFAPLILVLDLATVVYGARLVSKIQRSSKRPRTFIDVIRRAIYLFGIRVLWGLPLVHNYLQIDQMELQVYKQSRVPIKQIVLAVLLVVGCVVGFFWMLAEILSNISLFKSGQEDTLIVLVILLSALALACMNIIYIHAKNSIAQDEWQTLFLLDMIEGVGLSTMGASEGAQRQGVSGSPLKGGTVNRDSQEEPQALYVALEFGNDEHAQTALHIYRTERQGQYQYLGLPEPNTIVIHRQDLAGLIDRLRVQGYRADREYTIRPVFLAGQLPADERKRLRRRGLLPSSKLRDADSLTVHINEAKERLESIKEKMR